MRLITRKIHRAFQALDHFSDAQCAHIVAAARGGIFARLCMVGIQLILAAGLALGVGGLLRRMTGPSVNMFVVAWRTYLLLSLFIALTIGTFGVTFLLVRDWLLRFKVHLLLQRVGFCIACRYNLIGLRVIDCAVLCPECGLPKELGPANTTTVIGTDGVARYFPSLVHEQARRNRWMKRKRMLRRIALALLAIIIAAAGTYEGFLHWQANKAKNFQRTATAALAALLRDGLGEAPLSPDEDAAIVLNRALAHYTARNAVDPTLPKVYVWPGNFLNLQSTAQPACLRLDARLQSPEIIAWCEQLRQTGLFNQLDALALCKGIQSDPLQISGWDSGGRILREWMKLSRINWTRMHTALATKNDEEFLRAFESNLAMARLFRQTPTTVSGLASLTILSDTLALGVIAVRTRREKEWLDAIESIVQRQSDPSPDSRALDGQELIALENLAKFFASPDNLRLGRWGAAGKVIMANPLAGNDDLWLGSFESVSAEIRDFCATLRDRLSKESYARTLKPVPFSALARKFVPYLQEFGGRLPIDERVLWQRALATVIALERFWIVRGAYPKDLAELVPEYLRELPRDPYSGSPLIYQRVDPEHPGGVQDFTLGSVGPNPAHTNDDVKPIGLAPWLPGETLPPERLPP
jgi:hypothetical protein